MSDAKVEDQTKLEESKKPEENGSFFTKFTEYQVLLNILKPKNQKVRLISSKKN